MTQKYKDVPRWAGRILSMRDEVEYHLMREKRTVKEEFILILKKESKLPRRLREFIINYYDETEQDETDNTSSEGHSQESDELLLPER